MNLPPFLLERYFAKWEFAAPYLLCASDVESHSVGELLALADPESLELWERLALGYTESQGHPVLRREIAGLYESIDPEEVLVFSGAEEAVFILSNVLLSHGDHAAVVWPCYQSLHETARSAGADVAYLELEERSGWRLDVDEVIDRLRADTKLVVVNFPHNPTGATLDELDFRRLVGAVTGLGAKFLSDEVYRHLEYDSADRLPAAADLSDRAVSLGVMSKAFGLAGLRIGWIATHDAEVLRRCAAFKDYTTICNSAPSEILAIIALRAKETLLTRNLRIVTENLTLLDSFVARNSDFISWVRPRAGAIGFPRLNWSGPVEEFARLLLEKTGVLVLPGSVYSYPGSHVRIGFGRKDFAAGLERLEKSFRLL